MTAVTDLLTDHARTARSSVIREILALVDADGVLSLAGGMPDPATFPVDHLATAAAAAIGDESGAALQYGRTEGVPELRALVAGGSTERCGRVRTADDVLITSGSQQALDLVGRAFLEPGDTVAIDDPGYLGAIQALGQHRPQWMPVLVDRDGLDTDALESEIRGGRRPKLVYTVTDFQNPTGAVLHPDRRRHLADLAERWGFVIVEDDPYGRIRFDEPVHPPIAAWSDRVISLGTTSKTISPGLRVGWAVGPAAVVATLSRLKQATDLHTSSLSQHLVLDLLSRPGWMAARGDELGDFYGPRAATLRQALLEALPDAAVPRARGGLFLWVDLPGTDTQALLPRAIEAGVAFVPGGAFSTDSSRRSTLRITFATLSADDLVTAAQRVGSVVRQDVA